MGEGGGEKEWTIAGEIDMLAIFWGQRGPPATTPNQHFFFPTSSKLYFPDGKRFRFS